MSDFELFARIIQLIIALKNNYKPTINPISKKLAKARSSEKKQNNVWNYLYNLDKQLKEKRDQSYLENRMKEEKKSLKECTFQPEITIGDGFITDTCCNKECDIYERSIQWKQNIEEK